jgi:hypothetical protein
MCRTLSTGSDAAPRCSPTRFAASERDEQGRPVGAGSDAHGAEQIGGAWVEIDDCDLSDPAAFLSALATGTLGGKGMGPGGRLAPAAAKLAARLSDWRGRSEGREGE